MTSQDINELLAKGFTPCLDFITQCYPKGVDMVFGKIFRYSSMSY